jgi:septum formation protein
MISNGTVFYLASKSPRRKKLLEQLELPLKVVKVPYEEEFIAGEEASISATRLAFEKLSEAKKTINDGVIITADTIVVLNGELIGKPVDEQDAAAILRRLSGNTHTVYTGFCVFNTGNGALVNDYEQTEVTFRELSDEEITGYIASGSPMDKAGAYGIQDDYGAVFITRINGCYYNVVGLPLTKVFLAIKKVLGSAGED